MEKKYELTNKTIEIEGRVLYGIRALKDLAVPCPSAGRYTIVNAGDPGGWVESEENLSQEGNCWIFDEARVYENARVYGNARIDGHAVISGSSRICDYANIRDSAKVADNAQVNGHALIKDGAQVFKKSKVHGKAEICKYAEVSGRAEIIEGTHTSGKIRQTLPHNNELQNIKDFHPAAFVNSFNMSDPDHVNILLDLVSKILKEIKDASAVNNITPSVPPCRN